jgi:NAD(P)-dependent dehydrogenase (short-subunit alcohol dehydrogenase family)
VPLVRPCPSLIKRRGAIVNVGPHLRLPGSRRPGQQRGYRGGQSLAEFVQQIAKAQNVTTGRMAEAEEVTALVAFLLSDVAGNMTGAD